MSQFILIDKWCAFEGIQIIGTQPALACPKYPEGRPIKTSRVLGRFRGNIVTHNSTYRLGTSIYKEGQGEKWFKALPILSPKQRDENKAGQALAL